MKLNKKVATIVSLALLGATTVAGTVAYLFTSAGPVENTFAPASVTSEVEEKSFTGKTKTDVQIKNTGDVDAFIRAKVVITWQNEDGDVYNAVPEAGKDYTITYADASDNWVEIGDYFYYTAKVTPEGVTKPLIKTAEVLSGANKPDGYSLSIEIIAEAIQADGVETEGENKGKTPSEIAWGVKLTSTQGQ